MEAQDNSHRQKLTMAERQSDRQKDCRVVQWTGKGTTQETLRPEASLGTAIRDSYRQFPGTRGLSLGHL